VSSAAPAAGRVGELCARYGLDARTRGALMALLAVLAEDPLTPTPIREPAHAVDVHLADSLAALELPVVRGAAALADLGAGAGFPGLALAAALPAARVAVVESAGRKCAFLERAAARAGLGGVEVACVRAESWADGLANWPVVSARALAALPVLAEYAAPLLTLGGALVAWKGRRMPEEEHAASTAAGVLGLELAEVRRVRPYPGAEHRHLYVFTKVSATPPGYPRRPGVAAKRPLGVRPSDRSDR